MGRSRGGFGTKVHVRAEGLGKPLVFVLTGGERHEEVAFEWLMEGGKVKRRGGGRPKARPRRMVGDKGYSSEKVRRHLRGLGVSAVIPRRQGQGRGRRFDRQAYRQRNRVERLINRLKQFRRIATRYEKRAANYLAMLTLAAILLWL